MKFQEKFANFLFKTSVVLAVLPVFIVVGAMAFSILKDDMKTFFWDYLPQFHKKQQISIDLDKDLLSSYNDEPGKVAAVIQIIRSDGGKCTAFVVSDKYALTAAHCLTNEFGMMITDDIQVLDTERSDTGILAKAASMNGRLDYGLIEANFTGFNKLVIVDAKGRITGHLTASNNLTSCGFANGGDLLCVPFKDVHPLLFGIKSDNAALFPGMSGGPVIDISTGRAIGINSYVSEQGGSVAISIVNVFDALGVKVK